MDVRSRRVTRVLGVRHLVQATLSGGRPSAEVLAVGVWVDTVHAATAVGLALSDRSRWRPALVDAAVAGVWAGLGRADLPVAEAGGEAWTDRAARFALPLLPGAARSGG